MSFEQPPADLSDFFIERECRAMVAYARFRGGFSHSPPPHWNDLPAYVRDACRVVYLLGKLDATPEPVATVIDNNQPGWTNIVETAPNVTLEVGTKLCRA